jgi:hypothetical protein
MIFAQEGAQMGEVVCHDSDAGKSALFAARPQSIDRFDRVCHAHETRFVVAQVA